MRWAVRLICLTAGFLIAAILGLRLLVRSKLTVPVRRPVELSPQDLDLPCRETSVRTDDGLTLSAWWIPAPGSSRAAVLVHGWAGDKSERHIVETALIYHQAGFSTLLLGLRGHGGSDGSRITAGQQEPYDVWAALSWLKDRGFEPGHVVLHGWSMGGVAVVRAAPKARVGAVIEEAAYADLTTLLGERICRAVGLASLPDSLAVFTSKLLLGLDPRTVRPELEAGRLSRRGLPLLGIHSHDDKVVPFGHVRRFERAYPGAIFWEIEGYEHIGAFAHPGYRRKLLDFLQGPAGFPGQ